MNPLSPRERSCLQWVAEGKTSWETARILGLTERTVNFHIHNACRKLGVHNRQAAITIAMREGLLCLYSAAETNAMAAPGQVARRCADVSCFAFSRCRVFKHKGRHTR